MDNDILSTVTTHREARLLIMCAMLLSDCVPAEFWELAERLKGEE